MGFTILCLITCVAYNGILGLGLHAGSYSLPKTLEAIRSIPTPRCKIVVPTELIYAMSSLDRNVDSETVNHDCYACGGTKGFLISAPVWRINEAANKGCVACDLVRGVVRNYAPEIKEEETVSIVRGSGIEEIMIGKDGGYPLRVSLYGHDEPNSIWLEYSKHANLHKPVGTELPDIGGDTSLPNSLTLIKRWIDKCLTTHDDCRQEKQSRLPNRVLDLGDTKDSSIRLYETQNEEAKYICLSHCWGDSKVFTTCTETLPQRIRGIEWSDLPNTFQDAVKVTRALGIRYLWIDSLCIIQNDANDWRQESAQMHTIYRDGYLTIAASKSKGPSGGLFSVSSPDYMLCEWRVNSQEEVIRTRRKITHFESSDHFPLLRRGWVFQERVLSRRILHFGPQELIWECMKEHACECSFFASALNEYERLGNKRLYRPVKEMDHSGWLMLVWWKIVQDYSALNLTYEGDIFPALSGVAKQHMAARDTRYFAGLWENTFVHDLLWYIPYRTTLPGNESQYNIGLRPSKWRAPTWSWAAVKSAVKYDHYAGFNAAIKIKNIDVKAVDENTAGQLVAASLIVSGEMATVTIQRQSSRPHGPTENFKSVSNNEILPVSFSKDYDIWAECDEQIEDGDELYFLLAAKVFENQSSSKKRDEVWFIVLRLVDRPTGFEDSEDFVYTRIGLATMEVTDDEPPEFASTFVHDDNVIII